MNSWLRATSWLAVLVAVAITAACGGGDSAVAPAPEAAPGAISLATSSNRADMISDGNARVVMGLPSGTSLADVSVDLNGSDVTSQFALRSDGRIQALLTGLRIGDNVVTAKRKTSNTGARLTIVNSSRTGNIFAGTPIQPWICATKATMAIVVSQIGTSPNATVATKVSGLDSDPIDADCNAPAKYSYYYQPKAKEGTTCTFGITGADTCFLAYDPSTRPVDSQIADFTNDRGDKVKLQL